MQCIAMTMCLLTRQLVRVVFLESDATHMLTMKISII